MKNSAAVLIVLLAASVLAGNAYAGGDNTPVMTNPSSGGGNPKPKPDNATTKGEKGSPEKDKEKRGG